MLEKTYQPQEVEARIYRQWEESGAFKCGRPTDPNGKPYCIVIPPPNVTGSLHMGHALNNTLQDVLIRFERMRGRDVLWQPGCDHAGIATQMVVERKLAAENRTDRRTMGREAFVAEVWRWKEQSGGTITNQLKRLGASCDWNRDRFTMDEGLSRAVLKVFVELYRKGLIYKDKRLVNWDPKFQTAISDLEVLQLDKRGSFAWADGQKDKDGNPVPFDAAALGKVLAKDPHGHLYYFRYPLAGKVKGYAKDHVVVATTRPETMLGDTGVAVNPGDKRYKALVKAKAHVRLPLVGREIPVVADDYSDPEKGTGAVKITPAHDENDFEVGKRHGLAQVNVLDAFGKILDDASVPEAYRGLDRYEARLKIVADLAALGLLEKIEPTSHTVPHGDRSGVAIEPWLTDQWYVRADVLAKPAIEAVESGRTRFVPESWTKTYYEWMRNIQPWCISRQLWWGHQIPAWYGPTKVGNEIDYSRVDTPIVAPTESDALAEAKKRYGTERVEIAKSQLDAMGPQIYARRRGDSDTSVRIWRDEDVLDTWFSSGLWAFSTLGWPDRTPELARYYPTNTLVTGFDIIFFWVARMMMLGLEFMDGQVPFDTVYIHALVRDEKGAKMSKSKGNVMDPLELIDQFGADALRFTLAAMAAQGRDIKLATSRVEGYRNFSTKLWNAARFAEMNGCVRTAGFDPHKVEATVNRWIAGETERAVAAVTAGIEAYKFNEAAGAAYQFVWGTYCDWYLELIKPILAGSDEAAKAETRATAAWAMDQILALLHPFMPFITEELWEKTGDVGPKRASQLVRAPWPRLAGLADADATAEIGWVVQLVSEIRSVRAEMGIAAGAQLALELVGAGAATRQRIADHGELIRRLARIERIGFSTEVPKGAVQIVVGEATVALPLAGVIDVAAERQRLGREIEKAAQEIDKIDKKLANEAFVAKAPEEVVEEQRERRAGYEASAAKLKAALERIAQVG